MCNEENQQHNSPPLPTILFLPLHESLQHQRFVAGFERANIVALLVQDVGCQQATPSTRAMGVDYRLPRPRLLKGTPSERGGVGRCLGDLAFRGEPRHIAHRALLEIGAFGGEAAANRFRIGIGPQVGQIRQQDVLGLG
jgi:hypothetical protein